MSCEWPAGSEASQLQSEGWACRRLWMTPCATQLFWLPWGALTWLWTRAWPSCLANPGLYCSVCLCPHCIEKERSSYWSWQLQCEESGSWEGIGTNKGKISSQALSHCKRGGVQPCNRHSLHCHHSFSHYRTAKWRALVAGAVAGHTLLLTGYVAKPVGLARTVYTHHVWP
jgi:hypothetical protein